MPAHLTPRFTFACIVCKKEFVVREYNANRGRNRFCSRRCYHAYQPTPLTDRFFGFIGKKTTTGCILWAGPTNGKKGYGILSSGGASNNGAKRLLAHRVSYGMFNGPIPSGLCVLHHCDTPLCINPVHLFLGTKKDNAADMMAKGRQLKGDKHPFRIRPELAKRGEFSPMAKITEQDVLEIRRRHADGEKPGKLAVVFRISSSQIHRIVQHQQWKHVS